MLIEINCLSINLSVAKFDWFIHMIVPFHQFKLEDSESLIFAEVIFTCRSASYVSLPICLSVRLPAL